MKVVHKFRLGNDANETTLKLKQGYKILHSEYVLVDKAICIWVEQTLDVEVPDKEVTFKTVNSGDPLPNHLQHVASVVDSFTPESYHIFKEPELTIKPTQLKLSKLRYTAA